MDPRVHIQWGSIFDLTPAPQFWHYIDLGRLGPNDVADVVGHITLLGLDLDPISRARTGID